MYPGWTFRPGSITFGFRDYLRTPNVIPSSPQVVRNDRGNIEPFGCAPFDGSTTLTAGKLRANGTGRADIEQGTAEVHKAGNGQQKVAEDKGGAIVHLAKEKSWG